MPVQVIEWPQVGSAARYPMGGWWVVEFTPGKGYWPLKGPFRARREAEDWQLAHLVSAAAEAGETIDPDELEQFAAEKRAEDARDEAYERAAARARGNDFADTGGKDWT